MQQATTSRRNWLKAMGLGAGALMGARWGSGADPGPAKAGVLRVAHITDVHVQPELGGGRGLAASLRHIQSRTQRPEFILNTGDCIMDAMKRDKARTDLQWELWRKVIRDECSLPIRHGIGNHDIWGWNKQRSGTTGQEALWGKKRAMEGLGLARPYYSFDAGAWHFIMLDSLMPFEDAYRARLDEEQFAWLEADLKGVGGSRPVLVASHVPIMSPASVLRTAREEPGAPGDVVSSGSNMHLDVRRLWKLFDKHPNVKLCVSGHLHQVDRAEYAGVTYITNPAVCGAWWKGKHLDRWGEMYTMLDLRPDGGFEVEYVEYGWTAEEGPVEAAAGG